MAHDCRKLVAFIAVGFWFASLTLPAPASAAEKFVYGLNWLPEAEHCGFFQAKARGLYEAAGLDVEIYPGGPGQNIPQLVAAGRVDAGMGTSMTSLAMRASGIAGVTIAAYLQKNPQTLVAHPDPALKTLTDLKNRKIAVANFSRTEFWVWLKVTYGFEDSQLRPYSYNPSAFVADKTMVQQGYITEDAYFLGKAIGAAPLSFLLAEYGYPNYASTVFTMEATLDKRSDAVKRFMTASTKGWTECMQGDPKPAFELIKVMDPEQSFELSSFKIDQMKKLALVEGGDAAAFGIGVMTDKHWKDLFDVMAAGGIYPKDLDYTKAYRLGYAGGK
jgi:NitT/TauT family transport system substrate-binding protein